MNRMNVIICNLFASALLALVLIACGDNGNVDAVESLVSADVVSNLSDLPKCSRENENLRVYVKSDQSFRICSQGDWFAIFLEDSSKKSIYVAENCFTASLDDSSGVKILCAGDSIGVVLNGKDGLNGVDGLDGKKGLPGEQGVPGNPGKDGQNGSSCSVFTLPENEGLAVVCGGDSVGVVLNGENGVDGNPGEDGNPGKDGLDAKNDPGLKCSLVNINCVVHTVCGLDTVSLEIPSNDKVCLQEVVLDSEAIAQNLEGIYGTSQKGPFLKSSEVVAYELLDGRTLVQTGNKFQGAILSDRGDFDIKTVSLTSQYAVLVVKGFYLNEVSGLPSSSQITLTSLTNLRGRSFANVNILTHLENERAQYLVVNEKYSVLAAKKRAERDVFALFHIDASAFGGYSEDLNVGGTSNADAALLAISILLQGDRSEAELTELMAEISSAIEKKGEWNNSEKKIEIAEWAQSADFGNRFEKIREHVADWKISEMVANFEPYVRNYWYQEFGLDSCTKNRNGVVKKTSAGKQKDSDFRFTCVDSVGTGNVWRPSTNLEKDTYGWEPGFDGQKKTGQINIDRSYIYDSLIGGWRAASNSQEMYWGGCSEKLEGTFNKQNGLFYICKSRTWTISGDIEVDTIGWTSDIDGSVNKGNETDANYVYDEIENCWRKATTYDLSLGVKGCTFKRAGEMIRVKEPSNADYGKYFICSGKQTWEEVADSIAENTYDYACDEDGKIVTGTKNSALRFVCDDSRWRETTVSEDARGLACTSKMAGSVVKIGDGDYKCQQNEWFFVPEPSAVLDSFPKVQIGTWDYYSVAPTAEYVDTLFVDPRDGKTYKLVRIHVGEYDEVWFAENLRFAEGNMVGYENLGTNHLCYEAVNGDCVVGGRFYSWTGSMNIPIKWKSNNVPADLGLIQNQHTGICPDGWHVPSKIEWLDFFEAVGTSPQTLVAKGFSSWNETEDAYGFSIVPAGYFGMITSWSEKFHFVGTGYGFWSSSECDGSYSASSITHKGFECSSKTTKMSIRCVKDENPLEKFNAMPCYKDGTITSGNVHPWKKYVCDTDSFRLANVFERKIGLGCSNYNEWDIKSYDDHDYACVDHSWVIDSIADRINLVCPEDKSVISGNLHSENKYVCQNGTIRFASKSEVLVNRLCELDSIVFKVSNGDNWADYKCQSGHEWRPMYFYEYYLDQWNEHLAHDEWPEGEFGSFTDSRDGRSYKTVVIDGNTWMAENLRYEDSLKTPNLLGNSICPGKVRRTCLMGGRLYTWNAAMNLPSEFGSTLANIDTANHQGICPDGWHLPSMGELKSLITDSRSMLDLVSKGFFVWEKATNKSGFSLIPTYDDDYIALWSSSEYESDGRSAHPMALRSIDAEKYYIDYIQKLKSFTESVRCVRNK